MTFYLLACILVWHLVLSTRGLSLVFLRKKKILNPFASLKMRKQGNCNLDKTDTGSTHTCLLWLTEHMDRTITHKTYMANPSLTSIGPSLRRPISKVHLPMSVCHKVTAGHKLGHGFSTRTFKHCVNSDLCVLGQASKLDVNLLVKQTDGWRYLDGGL